MDGMKLLNCALENALAFLFVVLPMKSRLKNPIIPVLAAIAGTAAEYFTAEAVPALRAVIMLVALIAGNLTAFKNAPEKIIGYSLIAVYITNLSDIIFGTLAALITDKNFSEITLSNSAERLMIKPPTAMLLAFTYLLLSKKDDRIPHKFWRLFDMVIFGFLTVTSIFTGAFVNTPAADDRTNLITVLAVSLIFLAASLAVVYFFSEICAGFQREQRLLLLETNYDYFKEQLVLQNENAQTLRKIRHDILNHLTNIRSLISLNEIDDAVRLLDETALKTEKAGLEAVNTGNRIADAVIMSKSAMCKSKNIAFHYKIEPLNDFSIDASDMSSLISNLLDNAIEAAERADKPYVELNIFRHNAYHVVRVENSISESEDRSLRTSKPNASLHGFGIKIVKDIAEKYDGNFTCKFDGDIFIATIFIRRNTNHR